MKKIILGAAVLAAMMATSCQNEELVGVQQQGNVIVNASTMNGSRTFVQGRTIYWSEGDRLLAFGDDVLGSLTLISEGNKTDGEFRGYVSGKLENLEYLIYPADMADYKDGKTTITIGTIDKNHSNAPMFAQWGSNVSFEQLTGMVRIQIKNVPANNNDLEVSGLGIGTAVFEDGAVTYSTKNNTIKVIGLTAGTNEICIPVFTKNTTAQSVKLTFKLAGATKELELPLAQKFLTAINVPVLKYENGQLVEETSLPTPEDPNAQADFEIKTLTDMYQFASMVNAGTSFNGQTVTLGNDIDLDNMPWTPIGNSTTSFQGTFDGQNHIISNLTINGEGKSNQGLFGMTTNGEIKNLTVNNAKVSGRLNVGVVAGTPYTSKYTNIKVTGHIEVNGMAYVGAVGGKNAYANWENIIVNVDDTSYVIANSVENGTAYRTYVGGVVGFNGEGGHSFKNITSNIDVKGSTIDVGGLFGIAHYGNQFENCVCTGDVEIYNASEAVDAEEIGGIAGVWHNENGTTVTFTNCSFTGKVTTNIERGTVWYNNLVGKPYSSTGTGKLIINGSEVIANGVSLNNDGEYLISNADGMFWFAKEVNENKNAFSGKTVKLVANIDLANAVWEPIGQTGKTEFKGIFDGQNKTIKNVNIDKTAATDEHTSSGLFGWAESNVIIKNVKIDGAIVKGNHNVAVIVGYTYSGKISNCHVTNADIVCTHANEDACGDKCGLIAGYAGDESRFTDCSASNSTVKAGRDAGQLIGTGYNVSVSNCSATNVTVTANGDCTGANIRNEVIGRVM